jgi:hypothetical protein
MMLRIQPGWAEVEGVTFLPFDVAAFLNALPGFRPKGAEVAVSREEFLKAIVGQSDVP